MPTQMIDIIDEEIIALAEADGRISNRAIAAALGISEKQAAGRLRRLVGDEAIRFAAVLDVFKAGFAITLALGVLVTDRPPEDVAADLARLPQILSVYLMDGLYRIEILVIAPDHDSLVCFVKEHLSRIEGIRSFSPSIHLDIFTFRNQRGHFIPYPEDALKILDASNLDGISKGIVRGLWEDSRATNQEIGDKLGLAEATVRARIAQLREQGIVRITAMRGMDSRASTLAYIGIELDTVHDEQRVVEALQAIEQISFGATVFGRFGILATAYAESLDALSCLVEERIRCIRGVRAATTTEVIKAVKYDYRLGIIPRR